VSLESEGKEMSRLNTHRHTDRHVNIELEFCKTEFAMKIYRLCQRDTETKTNINDCIMIGRTDRIGK